MTTVEERARQAQATQAAEKYADGARQFPRGPTGSVERAALVQGFKAGARWAATENRAALERANGLLREALEALHGEHDRQRVGMAPLRTAISEHLGAPSR